MMVLQGLLFLGVCVRVAKSGWLGLESGVVVLQSVWKEDDDDEEEEQ